MKIAGRCWCGALMAWVEKDPDDHLRCFGLRWCGKCGEVAPFAKTCVYCHREQARAYHEARYDDGSSFREHELERKIRMYRARVSA